jgi:hypothetical protein
MLRKTAIIYISFFAIAHLIAGCCDCGPMPAYRIKWAQPRISNHSYEINSGRVDLLADTSNNFSAKNYAMSVNMGYELLAAKHHCGIINQAYACKCDQSASYTPNYKLSSIKVFTVNAYDSTHPAQSEVTGYFKSQKFSDGIADGLGDLNLNLSQGVFYNYPGSFFLMLGNRPGPGTVQQFRVEVMAENDSTYMALSPVLQF